MPFLSIDGFTVEVANNSGRTSTRAKGNRGRTAGGVSYVQERPRRRRYSFVRTVASEAAAYAFARLVAGTGHHVPLRSSLAAVDDDHLAGTALGPLMGYAGVTHRPAAANPFATGCTRVEEPGVVGWDPQFGDRYFVHWFEDVTGTGWEGRGFDSAGRIFIDGVLDEVIGFGEDDTLIPTVLGGAVKFVSAAQHSDFCHLTLRPYVPDDDMIAAIGTNEPGLMPEILVDGDAIDDGPRRMLGTVKPPQFVQMGGADGWENNALVVAFDLTDIGPAWRS